VFSALADRTTARPRLTLLAVVLFVALAGVLGGPVAGALEDSGGFTATDSGSTRAVERIREATGRHVNPGIVALLETPAGAGSAAGRERIAAVERTLSAVPGIAAVVSADSTRDPSFVSRDGRATYLAATLDADADEELVLERVTERFAGADDVVLGGSIVAGTQIGDSVTADLGRAEALAFPILLLLSLVFFRGRAAVLPLVAGVTTVLGTFLALAAVNQVYGLSIFALNLVIGLGLGLSIDYMLFLVTRFREELEQQGAGAGAIRTTMNTAGRTVAYSAVTVACALITLTVFPLGFLQSMGIAGAVVALVAGLAALVIAPTLFALWGAKLAVRRRRPERPAEQGTWYRLSKAVMRRPLRVAIVTGVLMLAVAAPSLRAVWTPVDSSVIPKGQSSRTVADTLARDFGRPGHESRSRSRSTRRTDAGAGVARYAAALERLPGVKRVSEPRALDGATWRIDVAVAGAPEGDAAQSLVAEIRERPAPVRAARHRRRGGVRRPAGRDRIESAACGRTARRAHVRGALADDRFGRAARQGDPDERPHRRLGARGAHPGLPGRPFREPARIHEQRRRGADGLPRRGGARVRALDRLRRLPARPHQGGQDGRALRSRGCRDRGRAHRRGRHGRRHPARRGDRRVHHLVDLVHPADRRRDRGGCADRRVLGTRAARALADGAARCWNWWSPRPLARLHTRIGLEEAGAPTI
jgi:preprotein translocase subunit SecF